MKLARAFRSLPTVEERLFMLNSPKYYGWYAYSVNPGGLTSGTSDLAQYATWTHVVPESEGLPSVYGELEKVANRLCNSIYDEMDRAVIEEYRRRVPYSHMSNGKHVFYDSRGKCGHLLHSEETSSARLVGFINYFDRVLTRSLARSTNGDENLADHLIDNMTDISPRSEAFWFRGGFNPDKAMVKKRLGLKEAIDNPSPIWVSRYRRQIKEEAVYKKYDRAFQYVSQNLAQIRTRKMIAPYLPISHELCRQANSIPRFPHDPRNVHIHARCQRAVNTPGIWSHISSHPFTSIQYVPVPRIGGAGKASNSFDTHPEVAASCRQDALLSAAVFASFGQSLAQATLLGSGPFIDPTAVPMTMQTVLTDGKNMKLIAYQLNKTELHFDFDDLDPIMKDRVDQVNNVMWQTPEMAVVEVVPLSNGSVTMRLNKKLLRELIKFYLMKPTISFEEANTPVVSEDGPLSIDNGQQVKSLYQRTSNNYNRQYMHNTYRAICSRRDRHFLKPKIESHEKIFEIERYEPTLPGDEISRQAWWKMAKIDHLGREHWHPEFKRLDHYRGTYLPKKFRVDKGTKYKYAKKVVVPVNHGEENLLKRRLD